MNMELGTAKRVITPPRPVRLAGYATRTTPFDSVLEDIYVRVHDYRCGSARAVLVYGGTLSVGGTSEFVAMARPCLAAALGVKEEQILFTASHNHSGPGTGGNFTPLLETVDAEGPPNFCTRRWRPPRAQRHRTWSRCAEPCTGANVP